MALTYEKFYGGVSNAEQLMYKKSCVFRIFSIIKPPKWQT